MISLKLKNIFILSIPLFILHGLEEYLTGIYNVDSHVKFIFSYFYTLPNPQAVFLLFQIMFWLVLVTSALLISGEKWQLRLMIMPGIVYIYELHHIYKAILVGGYYPGLITAALFPIFGYIFWREFIRSYKNYI